MAKEKNFSYFNIALHCASSANNFKAIEILIQKGANVRAVNHDGSGVLHYLVRSPPRDAEFFQSILRSILEKGADINLQ